VSELTRIIFITMQEKKKIERKKEKNDFAAF